MKPVVPPTKFELVLASSVLAAVVVLAFCFGDPYGWDSSERHLKMADLVMGISGIPLDDRPAPGFSLGTLDGRTVSLAGFRGRPVLLYFWATW